MREDIQDVRRIAEHYTVYGKFLQHHQVLGVNIGGTAGSKYIFRQQN